MTEGERDQAAAEAINPEASRELTRTWKGYANSVGQLGHVVFPVCSLSVSRSHPCRQKQPLGGDHQLASAHFRRQFAQIVEQVVDAWVAQVGCLYPTSRTTN